MIYATVWYILRKVGKRMGKFDGVLLCTDMDGTLLNSNSAVSPENKKAIEYFMSEGGSFTFITGRAKSAVTDFYNELKPNLPAGILNGAAVADIKEQKELWSLYLDSDADKVIDLAVSAVSELTYAVYTSEQTCFESDNDWFRLYFDLTNNEHIEILPHTEINGKWFKIIFICSEEDVLKLKETLNNSEFADRYDFIQSGSNFYEALPKGASKGKAMKKIIELSNRKFTKTIAVGDNENDISSIEFADVGIAVENAHEAVKQAADYITVSNEEHAIREIIRCLENGTF